MSKRRKELTVEENVAILVDGGFYQRRARSLWGMKTAEERANELYEYCKLHLYSPHQPANRLYRIFYYDCPPSTANVYHPFKRTNVSLSRTELYRWMTDFHEALKSKRKVALRLGELSAVNSYTLRPEAVKKLFGGERSLSAINEDDFVLNIGQKGVDMRIGLDIASMAYKKQVTQIVLISGDSDFVPAAKLARREGVDFILDSMQAVIKPSLSEHVDGLRNKINFYNSRQNQSIQLENP
nr:MAG TPA: hypothetical protein [Caudoviricetes sp.]